MAHVRVAFVFGVFVFLFLYVFQPFKLGTYTGNLALLTAGYGAVCTVVMLILNVVIAQNWSAFFNEEKWTVGREILWTVVNVACIGLANALYTNKVGAMQLNVRSIFYLEMYTVAIAVFPISLAILYNESRLSRKFEKRSEVINKTLTQKQKLQTEQHLAGQNITITSENAGESFAVRPENVLFMKAAENYTEIYLLQNNLPERRIVRASLKRIEADLPRGNRFLRCHKSYLVNLNHVDFISGNAQGFKLHLHNLPTLIPVSRAFNNSIKELL